MFNMTFTGVVATQPEVGYTKDNDAYTHFRMALYRGKDQEPTWITVWLFGKTAEFADNIGVTKGDWVAVSSDRPFRCEAWQDKKQNMGVDVSVYASRIDKQPAKEGVRK